MNNECAYPEPPRAITRNVHSLFVTWAKNLVQTVETFVGRLDAELRLRNGMNFAAFSTEILPRQLKCCFERRKVAWFNVLCVLQSNTWRKIKVQKGTNVPKGRRGHSALVHRGSMLLYGGYRDLRGSSSELWAFHFGEYMDEVSCDVATEILRFIEFDQNGKNGIISSNSTNENTYIDVYRFSVTHNVNIARRACKRVSMQIKKEIRVFRWTLFWKFFNIISDMTI